MNNQLKLTCIHKWKCPSPTPGAKEVLAVCLCGATKMMKTYYEYDNSKPFLLDSFRIKRAPFNMIDAMLEQTRQGGKLKGNFKY